MLMFRWTLVHGGKTPPVGEVVKPDERLSTPRMIGLGAPPTDPSSASVQFEVLRFADTEPGSLGRRHDN